MDRHRATPRRLPLAGRAAVAVALAVGVVWLALPRLAGVGWHAIAAVLGTVPATVVVGLLLLWAGGLLAHSFVVTAALPGLSRRRALTLSLTGSAVSNVVPFGGALGVALNFAMVRAWRFPRSAYASYVTVTNAWDVLAKLTLPLTAALLLTATGALPGRGLQTAALVGAGVVVGVVALGAGVLCNDGVARSSSRAVAAGLRLVGRRGRSSARHADTALLEARDRIRGVVRARWPQLTAGMAGYVALQGALLWCCLHAVGLVLPFPAVIAALATDRLLSIIPLTPGGAGFAEVGTAAALIGFGADPLGVAAGVLLYRAFTFLLEIPVGGVWLGCWLALRPRTTAVVA